jgi:hypothetical protein
MPLVLSNRVQETATANTTVSFTLTGAVAGFQTFATIGNGNTTYYSGTDGAGNWEVGLGTYSTTGPTLTRTTIYASSNAGSAVTFSGAVNVFVTYPSGRSVNLDASGNVSALGNVSSGVWQGTTVAVAYGGTGVTASSGANSVVLRDANENITINRLNQGLQTVTAAGGVTALTAASDFNQLLVGSTTQTFRLPDATTLSDTTAFQFNNASTGTLTVQNNAAAVVGTVPPGGAANAVLNDNTTVPGTWEFHGYLPEGVTWGTNALAMGSTVVTGGTWNGGTITSAYGGTGLTTFTAANNALYSTAAGTLVAGTLPVLAGGTGVTTSTGSGNVVLSTSPTLVTPALGTPASGILTNCTFPTLNQNTTGTAANVTGIVAFANGGTGETSRQDAMDALAGAVTSGSYLRGNGTDVVMATIQAADVPTLNQNTTGTAANVTGVVAVANGGTGQSSYTDGQLLIGNSTGNTLTKASLSAGTGISITPGSGTITIASTVSSGVTSVTGTAPVASSGGTTPAISLAANYGDTQNPYASKTANNFLAAPDGAAGVPTFRAVVATDIPTLNQNTTGSAGNVANAVTFNNGGSGDASGTIYNGSAARTISYNTIGAQVAGTYVTGVTATAPVASSGGTAPVISMPAATSSVNGYLTSTDWSTFNGKGSVTGVTATSPVASSGGTAPVISMPAATSSVNGYLTSTDWSTFNGKGSGTVTGVTATSPVASSGGTAPVISMPAATSSVNGYLTSTDWSTFNGKGSVTGVTATSPVASSGGTAPVISMPAATSSVNGYLTSTDWSTFNGKGNGTVTGVTATSPVASTGGTAPVISMSAATSSVNGYLTSTDWSTFNGKGNGTVTSVGGTGTVSGLSLGGTVTTSGNLSLSGTLSVLPSNFASQTANTFLAAPNGSAGTPTFRGIAAADVPTLNQNTTGSSGSCTGNAATATSATTAGSATTATTATNVSGGTVSSARINPRVSSQLSAASITPTIASFDQYNQTDQFGTLTINAPTGTPVDGNKLLFRIATTAAGAAITWNATYTAIGVTLPTTTVTNKTIYVGCIYNAFATRWDVVAVVTQA